MTRQKTFFDELVEQLRRVPVRQLPAVAAMLRGASRPSTSYTVLDDLAAALTALPLDAKLDAIVDAVVLHAFAETGGNQSAAARLLGIDRKAYGRRLSRARARRAKAKAKSARRH